MVCTIRKSGLCLLRLNSNLKIDKNGDTVFFYLTGQSNDACKDLGGVCMDNCIGYLIGGDLCDGGKDCCLRHR